MIIAVPGNSPIKSLQELVTQARAKPKGFKTGLPSTTARLVLELCRQTSGTDILPISYVGTPAALTDAISGRVATVIDTSSALLGNIKAGTLRPLAIATEKRMETCPNVATFRDLGFDVVMPPANGLFGPKGITPQVVTTVNAAVNKAFAERELKEAFIADGAQPIGGAPEVFDRMMRAERVKWKAIVKATGLKVE